MSETPESTPNTEVQKPADNPLPTTPSANTGASEQTFTQAELDRIIADRLKRDREAQQTKWLESLGVSSLDDAKTALEAKRKSDEAAMSELEKAQAEIEKARKQAQEAMEAKQALEAQIVADKSKQAFLQAVRTNGGTNPDRVYALLQVEKPNDYTAVFGDDGTPDESKLKSLIKQVQTDYAEYFATSGAGSPSVGNGIAPRSTDNTEQAAEEWLRRLRS